MNNTNLDTVGEILWWCMFITPVITIPPVWWISKRDKTLRVLIGLCFALLLSLVLFIISMAIFSRNGMGV
jgi:hypothetical protein